MSKKRSLIALLILAVSALTVCCLLSCRIYADADTTFDAFTDALFQEEVNSNSITLHYTLQNPDNYGIRNPIISFGNYSVSSSDISTAAERHPLCRTLSFQSDHLETFRGFLLQHSVRNSISVIQRTHQPSYRDSDTASYFII